MQQMRGSSASFARVLLIAAASAALGACQPAAEDNAVDQSNMEEPVVNLPVSLPVRSMDRAAILDAVRDAASAAAAGIDDTAAQRGLEGRPFEFRIRFGCRGPATDLQNKLLAWSFEPQRRTLRVRAMPTISADDAVAARIAGEEVEAVEGFWVPRPWLINPVCPAAAAVAPAPPEPAAEKAGATAPGGERSTRAAVVENEAGTEEEVQPSLRWPKVGIAQFFTSADSRTRRRDTRAYETVTTLERGQPIGSQGYNLVLSGRLKPTPGRRVIECVTADADTPPDCIVSADFDRVWIEDPDSKEIVAEWGSG